MRSCPSWPRSTWVSRAHLNCSNGQLGTYHFGDVGRGHTNDLRPQLWSWATSLWARLLWRLHYGPWGSWGFSCSSRSSLIGQAGPSFFHEWCSNMPLDLESFISAGATGISLVGTSFLVFWTAAIIRSCESGLAEGFNVAWLENGLTMEGGGTCLPARMHIKSCLIA